MLVVGGVGVILVYNPDNRGHESEIELWMKMFVTNTGLKPEQVLVLAHRTGASGVGGRLRARTLSNLVPGFNLVVVMF